MTEKEKIDLVDKHSQQLGEHFEVVQILVSHGLDGGGTENVYSGVGNWFARQGMAHDFITKDQATTHANKLADKISPPDDTESWKSGE